MPPWKIFNIELFPNYGILVITSFRYVFSLVTLYSIVFDLYILGRDDSDSGGSSAAAIAQGVTGGIIGVFVIVIIIIVIGYLWEQKFLSQLTVDTLIVS